MRMKWSIEKSSKRCFHMMKMSLEAWTRELKGPMSARRMSMHEVVHFKN